MRCTGSSRWVDAVRVVQTTMQWSAPMSENCSYRNAAACGGAIRPSSVCDRASLMLVILILMRTSHALAGEQGSLAIGPVRPGFDSRPGTGSESLPPNSPLTAPLTAPPTASLFDLPKAYQSTDVIAGDLFSPSDFRPRGPSVLGGGSHVAPEDAPMLHGSSVWQRLADYRSHGRVRLLTLWETGGSSVSLQAGRKGEPSLQWTSRSMNRGGATRGVFDQLFSMAGVNRGSRPAARPSQIEAPPRPSKPSDAAMGANK